MELASSSRGILRIAQETLFGVTPTVGNHKLLPFTGESLTYQIEKTASEEINPNRGVSDMVPTTASASGGVNIEFKATTYDYLIEAALQGAWAAEDVTPLEITATATELSIATGAFPVANLVRGQFIGISSPVGEKNYRRLLRISDAADAIQAQLIKLDASTPAEAGVMTGVYILGSRLRNGVERRSYTIEKEFSDVGVFRAYRGMNVSSMAINAAQGALTTGEFQFMGRDGTKKTAATVLPGTQEALQERRVMTGMTGTVCGIWVDKQPLTGTFLSSLALSYDNNLRQQNAMCSADANGVAGAVGIGNGNITTTMSAEIYFSQEDTLYDQFVDNENVEVAMTAFDSEGYGYVFTYPKANITSHETSIQGNNQDVLASVELTGLQINSTDAKINGGVLFVDRIKFP
jgi:hypothetical protein